MQITIVYFDPNYWIFSLGIALHRYEEYTENYEQFRVRRELEIGLLMATISFHFNFPKELPDEINPGFKTKIRN